MTEGERERRVCVGQRAVQGQRATRRRNGEPPDRVHVDRLEVDEQLERHSKLRVGASERAIQRDRLAELLCCLPHSLTTALQ